jgi:hypothetical protein
MILDPEMFVYNLCDLSYHPFSLIIFTSLEAYWRLPPRGYRSCTTLWSLDLLPIGRYQLSGSRIGTL